MKLWLKISLCILAVIAVDLGVTSPIHELGHFLAAVLTGGKAEFAAWNLTHVWGGNTTIVSYAGYALHMAFYAFMASLRRTGWSCIGTGGFIGVFAAVLLAKNIPGQDRYGMAGWLPFFLGYGILLVLLLLFAKYYQHRYPKEATRHVSRVKPPTKYVSPIRR